MDEYSTPPKAPYQFGQAISLPFRNGPGSTAFVLKSAVIYALAMTVLMAFIGRFLVSPMVEYVEAMRAMEDATTEAEILKQTTKLMGAMGRVMLPYMLIMLSGWVVWATIEAEQHRRAMRDECRTGLFPWRFGVDELFVMLAHFVLYMCYMGLYLVIYIAIIISTVIVTLMAMQSTILGIIGGVIAGAILIAALSFMFWILIRLAPTAALSVASKDLAIGQAWSASKGRVWPTFFAYLLIYLLGTIVIYGLSGAVGIAFVGSIMSELKAAGAGSGSAEIWEHVQNKFTERDTQVGFIIGGFILFFFIGLWFQMIAGINSHVAKLYKTDQAAESIKMFE